jgi:hypothetical protein
MIAAKHHGFKSGWAEARRQGSACTRCGRMGRMHTFPRETPSGGGDLCGDCRAEWDHLLADVAERWHAGLRICFFCRRELGDQRFPARSPFGTSCAECGLSLAALIKDSVDP